MGVGKLNAHRPGAPALTACLIALNIALGGSPQARASGLDAHPIDAGIVAITARGVLSEALQSKEPCAPSAFAAIAYAGNVAGQLTPRSKFVRNRGPKSADQLRTLMRTPGNGRAAGFFKSFEGLRGVSTLRYVVENGADTTNVYAVDKITLLSGLKQVHAIYVELEGVHYCDRKEAHAQFAHFVVWLYGRYTLTAGGVQVDAGSMRGGIAELWCCPKLDKGGHLVVSGASPPPSRSPSPAASPSATASPSASASPSVSATPLVAPSLAPSAVPSAVATPRPTPRPTPVATRSSQVVITHVITPPPTAAPTPARTPTPTPTSTPLDQDPNFVPLTSATPQTYGDVPASGVYLPKVAVAGTQVFASIVGPGPGAQDALVGIVAGGETKYFKSRTDRDGHLTFTAPASATSIVLFRALGPDGAPDASAQTCTIVARDANLADVHVPGTQPVPAGRIPQQGPAITEALSGMQRGDTIDLHVRGVDPSRARVTLDGFDAHVTLLAASSLDLTVQIGSGTSLGRHDVAVASNGVRSNAVPADVIAMLPDPLAGMQIGVPIAEHVRVDGLPRGHGASVHVTVEGAAEFADGSSETDVPVMRGVATVMLKATQAGSVTLRYTLHVSIPGYWEAGA